MGLSKEFLRGLMNNPNFKKWFGESVVRDAEGLPLEVYHGTGRPGFSQFMRGQGGYIYFTPESEYASRFAGNTGGMQAGFLDVKNPLDLTRFGDDLVGGVRLKDYIQDAHDIDLSGIDFRPDSSPVYQHVKHPDLKWRLEDHGHDGIKQIESGTPAYLAFQPEQFKSRFNQGTFDPTDPNFLKSAGLMTAGTGAAAYAMSPDDAEAASLPRVLDFGDIRLPLDAKGMATLYHATSPEAADKIVASKMLKSAGEPSVYFSTSKEGTGYGPAVVEAKVPGSMLQMDDVFPDGRADFRVDRSTLPLAYAKRIAGLGLTGAGAYGLMGSDSDAEASYIGPKGLANLFGQDAAKSMLTDAEKMAAKGVDNEAAQQAGKREWAKDAGSNTPNVAQAVAPSDPFTPSPSQLASTAALVAALKSKDAPLEDTYQPADLLAAFLTGGGGLMSRGVQAALDPAVSAAFDYVPRFADAINPRNIVMGLMR